MIVWRRERAKKAQIAYKTCPTGESRILDPYDYMRSLTGRQQLTQLTGNQLTGNQLTGGVILVAHGVEVLVNPVQMIGGTGVQLPTATAVADGRATYGGLILGLGAFFIFSALNNARVRTGLWAEVFTMGGFGVGRTLAVLVDNRAGTSLLLILITFKTVLALLGVIGLWRLPRQK